MDTNPEWKQLLLETISQIEDSENTQPVVFKWRFPEKPEWTIALGFKKDV